MATSDPRWVWGAGYAVNDKGKEYEDHSLCRQLRGPHGEPIVALCVADGLGSRECGKAGAEGVCEGFMNRLAGYLEQRPLEALSRAQLLHFARAFHTVFIHDQVDDVRRHAEYSTTFLAAIVSETGAWFVQCGDGAILYSLPDIPEEFSYHCLPIKGAFGSQTVPINDRRAWEVSQVTWLPAIPARIALFSDGLEDCFIHPDGTLYPDMLIRYFDFIERVRPDPAVLEAKLSRAIETDPKLNSVSKTDDKTLALISTRVPEVSS